jgi:hypothetical protein
LPSQVQTDPVIAQLTGPDRNAGIWKPVYLRATGAVSINHPLVNTELLRANSAAKLTVYANLKNLSARPINGTLKGTISRPGKPTLPLVQPVQDSVAIDVGPPELELRRVNRELHHIGQNCQGIPAVGGAIVIQVLATTGARSLALQRRIGTIFAQCTTWPSSYRSTPRASLARTGRDMSRGPTRISESTACGWRGLSSTLPTAPNQSCERTRKRHSRAT